MACSSRYAEAWQFTSWFCVEALLIGTDTSGGAGNAFLTDSQIDFTEKGVYANVGMVLYNLTAGTNGLVTAVEPHRLTAAGVTWDGGDSYRIAAITAQQRAMMEINLDQGATPIHAARAASGGCDCTLASWASDYLAFLNCVIAAAFYSCTCGRPAVSALSDDTRNAYRVWAQEQVDAIRSTKIELCQGETGSEFPVTGSAQQATTEFSARDIISGDWLRNNG